MEVCCISHQFSKAASANPDKIAIIHAIGGLHTREEACNTKEEPLPTRHGFDSPPIYAGDVVYTYAELQSAVNALAIRITNVLAGGKDPDLINPTGIFQELENGIPSDGKFSTGHMEGEIIHDWDEGVYKHCQRSASLSEQNMEEHPGEHSVHFSSPNIIGIYIVPSAEYIVAILAVLRSGGAFLPIDPSWPKERVLGILSMLKVRLVVCCCHASGFHVHENHQQEWLLGKRNFPVLCLSDGYAKGLLRNDNLHSNMSWPCQRKKQRLYCYVMHTSGSTGKPNGVCGTEKGLLNRFVWMETLYPLLDDDISFFKTAISFIDHLSEILGPLLSSTTLVIPPFKELRGNPLLVFDVLKAYYVTRLTAVPSLIRAVLPALQSSHGRSVRNFLRVLVLSGETFPIWLWELLHEMLPDTTILNLYGTTELSGDCTYFDCKFLPRLLECEPLNSVPIGKPIPGCELLLVAEADPLELSHHEGEIWVGGKCLAVKDLNDASGDSSKFVNLNGNCGYPCIISDYEVKDTMYFKTGDFARKLNDGNFVFVGRKDRVVKINGQRVAIEEIEYILRKHSDVADAAVSFHVGKQDSIHIIAYIVMKGTDQSFLYGSNKKEKSDDHLNADNGKGLHASLRSWLEERLPVVMIPYRFHFITALPLLSSGKIDYAALPQVEPSVLETERDSDGIHLNDIAIRVISEVFRRVLMVDKVSNHDDFFLLGGTSISVAHAAYTLGIDTHLIYKHQSPQKLHSALLQVPGLLDRIKGLDASLKMSSEIANSGKRRDIKAVPSLHDHNVIIPETPSSTDGSYEEVPFILDFNVEGSKTVPEEKSSIMQSLFHTKTEKHDLSLHSYASRPQKMQRFLELQSKSDEIGLKLWESGHSLPDAVAFSRCNKIVSKEEFDIHSVLQKSCTIFSNKDSGKMNQLWKALLHSCVDASPLFVKWHDKYYIFIGSHAHNFLCIDAYSGYVQWEAELGGRVESTAAVTEDFTQVVVGCYNGLIYFLEFLSGNILWSFQTSGEVKSQPVVDKLRGLIWCGSHDHNIYALDPKSQSCIFKLACGGSVFGAPAYDMVRNKVYVSATSGRVTAINIEDTQISVSWLYESRTPIFGSPAVESCTGYVICTMVSGNIIALSTTGACVWQARVDGPIFSGPCISPVVSSQVIVSSRDGLVYAFDLRKGNCLWKHLIGEPITSSVFVDETIQFLLQHENQPDTIYRLACVCSTSGTIYILKFDSDAANRHNIAYSDPFSSLEEPQNVAINNSNFTNTKGQIENCGLKFSHTDAINNSEDQKPNGQFTLCYEYAKLELPGEIFSSPIMVGGRIFVGCRDDHVYCIDVEL